MSPYERDAMRSAMRGVMRDKFRNLFRIVLVVVSPFGRGVMRSVMRDEIITHRSLHVAIGASYFLSRTPKIVEGGVIIRTSGSGNPHHKHVLCCTDFSRHTTAADIFKHVKNVQENSRFSYQRERLVELKMK